MLRNWLFVSVIHKCKIMFNAMKWSRLTLSSLSNGTTYTNRPLSAVLKRLSTRRYYSASSVNERMEDYTWKKDSETNSSSNTLSILLQNISDEYNLFLLLLDVRRQSAPSNRSKLKEFNYQHSVGKSNGSLRLYLYPKFINKYIRWTFLCPLIQIFKPS